MGTDKNRWPLVSVFERAAVPDVVTVDLRVTCFYCFQSQLDFICGLFYYAFRIADFISSTDSMID